MQAKSPWVQVPKMLSSSRIVFSEDIGGVSPWQPREFGRPDKTGPATGSKPAAQAPAATFEDGLKEGLRRGLEQARAEAAQAQQRTQEEAAQRVASVVEAATQALAQVQQVFAERVAVLALEIARSATGATIEMDMNLVGPVIQKALESLTDEGLKPVVRIHPTDVELFGPGLQTLLARHQASLVADPQVDRGGCVVDTATSRMDATIATRWQDTIASMGLSDPWIRSN